MINVFIPIIIGFSIYMLFRNNTLIMFDWFDNIGGINIVVKLRDFIAPLKKHMPNWLLFSLPDGLWCYSFVSAFLIIDKRVSFWLLIPFLFGVGIEILQYYSLFKGTYDSVDVFFYILGFFLPFISLNKIIKSFDFNFPL